MLAAIVNENIVTSIVTINTDDEYQAHSRQNQIVVDVTDYNPQPSVGWVFNGIKINPPAGQTAVPSIRITRLAMRNRFTTGELAALYTNAASNVMLQILKDNLSVAEYIDLKRPDTIGGIQYLWSIGILTTDRMNAILNTAPTDIEKYKGT